MRLLHVFPATGDIKEIADSADQGLAHSYLLGYINKYAEFPVEYRIINRDIFTTMEDYKPDIVAITGMTYNFHNAAKVATKAKEMGATTIVGGHHLSNLPRQLTANMDVGVLEEGEVTYLELLNHYHQGKWEPQYLKDVRGIVFRTETGDLQITSPRPLVTDVDSLGHPLREDAPSTQSTRFALLTSRGCPYKCGFCSQTRFWHSTMRFHSPEYVIEEIERIYKLSGTDQIRIDDGVFLINKPRLLKILDLWEKHPLHGRIGFTCWTRANLVNDGMAEIARRMGIHTVKLGIESNNPESLAYLKGKDVTVEDNQRAYDILTKHKIRMMASFIIGSPRETESQIMDTYQYIKRNRLLFGDVNVLVPIPGTPVWDDAVKRGLVADDTDFSLLGGHNLDRTVFLSEVLSQEKVTRLARKFYGLMKRRNLYLRCRRFLIYASSKPWLIPGKIVRELLKLVKPRADQSKERYEL